MWTRFEHIDEVPTGLPLMYLTLLALEYMPTYRIRPKGSTVLDMMREPQHWINDALYTRIADCLEMAVDTDALGTVAVAKQGSHRVSVSYPNRNVAIARCAVTLILTPMQLVVPTELVISYERWRDDLAREVGLRAGMGGKSQTAMAMLKLRGPLEPMLALAKADSEVPAEYLARLQEEFDQSSSDVVVVGAAQPGIGYIAPFLGVTGTVTRPRTRVAIVGAGQMLHQQMAQLMLQCAPGVELVDIDSCPEEFTVTTRMRHHEYTSAQLRPVFEMDLAPTAPIQTSGCPYLGVGGGDTHPFLPKGHAQKVKNKRKVSRLARKQTRRNK